VVKVLIKEERKALERNPGDFLKKFEREKMFIKNLIHPNIIKYYDVKECKTRFYIVMELAEADTIDKHIHYNHGMEEVLAKRLFRQVAEALNFMQLHDVST